MRECFLGVVLLASVAGCVSEETPKASHFEHDHEVAAHWPDDLADAAAKLRERLARLNGGPADSSDHPAHDHDQPEQQDDRHSPDGDDEHEADPEHHDHLHDHDHEDADPRDKNDPQRLMDEITDLVSWVPEIAADTNLSEADWLPLDDAAESLTANLRAAGGELTESNQQQVEALCDLITASVTKIPEQLPPFKALAP